MNEQSRRIPVDTNSAFHPLSTLRTEAENVCGHLADGFRSLHGDKRQPSAEFSKWVPAISLPRAGGPALTRGLRWPASGKPCIDEDGV